MLTRPAVHLLVPHVSPVRRTAASRGHKSAVLKHALRVLCSTKARLTRRTSALQNARHARESTRKLERIGREGGRRGPASARACDQSPPAARASALRQGESRARGIIQTRAVGEVSTAFKRSERMRHARAGTALATLFSRPQAPIIPVSCPAFCRVLPGMRSIHPHKCHLSLAWLSGQCWAPEPEPSSHSCRHTRAPPWIIMGHCQKGVPHLSESADANALQPLLDERPAAAEVTARNVGGG